MAARERETAREELQGTIYEPASPIQYTSPPTAPVPSFDMHAVARGELSLGQLQRYSAHPAEAARLCSQRSNVEAVFDTRQAQQMVGSLCAGALLQLMVEYWPVPRDFVRAGGNWNCRQC